MHRLFFSSLPGSRLLKCVKLLSIISSNLKIVKIEHVISLHTMPGVRTVAYYL